MNRCNHDPFWYHFPRSNMIYFLRLSLACFLSQYAKRFFNPGWQTELIIIRAKKRTKEGKTLPEITYNACVGWKWDAVWFQLQSWRRLSGAQLVQFLLQKKPLHLQLGSQAQRQGDLLPTLLHRMSLTELVDPGHSQGRKIIFRVGPFQCEQHKGWKSQ